MFTLDKVHLGFKKTEGLNAMNAKLQVTTQGEEIMLGVVVGNDRIGFIGLSRAGAQLLKEGLAIALRATR